MPESAPARQPLTRGSAEPPAPGMTGVIWPGPGPDDALDMATPRTTDRARGPFRRLRAQHARALEHLGVFERAFLAPSLREREARALGATADFLSDAFDAHLAVEDGVLFPALLEQLPELAGTLEALREEHAEIRATTRGLVTLLGYASTPERDEQLAVLGRDLTDLLRLHIGKEERLVLDWSGRVLPAPIRRDLEQQVARVLDTAVPRNRMRP